MQRASRHHFRAIRAASVVVTLAVVATGCGGGSEAEGKTPVNIRLDVLHDSAVSAGLACDSFTQWTDAAAGGAGVTEMGTCNPGARNSAALIVYTDHDAAASDAARKVPNTLAGPSLLGENWLINSEQAEELSDGMEGEFLPPDEGWADQDQCEDQVMEIVGSMFTDQMGETSEAWQQAVFKYGTEDPAFEMSLAILQAALPQLSTNGLESALAVAGGEASTRCTEYLAAPVTVD